MSRAALCGPADNRLGWAVAIDTEFERALSRLPFPPNAFHLVTDSAPALERASRLAFHGASSLEERTFPAGPLLIYCAVESLAGFINRLHQQCLRKPRPVMMIVRRDASAPMGLQRFGFYDLGLWGKEEPNAIVGNRHLADNTRN